MASAWRAITGPVWKQHTSRTVHTARSCTIPRHCLNMTKAKFSLSTGPISYSVTRATAEIGFGAGGAASLTGTSETSVSPRSSWAWAPRAAWALPDLVRLSDAERHRARRCKLAGPINPHPPQDMIVRIVAHLAHMRDSCMVRQNP